MSWAYLENERKRYMIPFYLQSKLGMGVPEGVPKTGIIVGESVWVY